MGWKGRGEGGVLLYDIHNPPAFVAFSSLGLVRRALFLFCLWFYVVREGRMGGG